MTFKEDVELMRMERLTALYQARELRIYHHTQKLATIETALANGVITAEERDASKDRENRHYEYDIASFQSAIDDLNAPELPRITPEMMALWQDYDARVKAGERLTGTELVEMQDNLEFKLWRMFCALMRSQGE